MLGRSQRISTREFNEIMKKGKVSHSSLFLMRNTHVPGSKRFAAVAPTKIEKTAVGRNRLRRKMYALVRELNSSVANGVQALIFAKAGAKSASPSDLRTDLRTLFVKAGLLR